VFNAAGGLLLEHPLILPFVEAVLSHLTISELKLWPCKSILMRYKFSIHILQMFYILSHSQFASFFVL
jgi:hypothetical protein